MAGKPLVPDELGVPWTGGEPVFAAPWQAEAFAIVVGLHQRGVFTWNEWVRTLSEEIASHPAAPGEDANDIYYRRFLAALETIVAKKGLLSPSRMLQRKEEWRLAYLHTPHGEAVDLARARLARHSAPDRHLDQGRGDDHQPRPRSRPVASS
jgi:nitrile hydratase accessory protein